MGLLALLLSRSTIFLLFPVDSASLLTYTVPGYQKCLNAPQHVYSHTLYKIANAKKSKIKDCSEFLVLYGTPLNHNADLSIETNRHVRNAWCSFRKYTLELYDRPSAPLELKIRMLTAEVFEAICTAASRVARPRATTTSIT